MQPRIEKTYLQRWLVTKDGERISIAEVLQHYIDNNDVLVTPELPTPSGAEIVVDAEVSIPLIAETKKKPTRKKKS